MQKIKFLFLIFFLLKSTIGISQFSYRDSAVKSTLIIPTVGYQKASGDWSTRFGYNQSIGLDILQKTKKNYVIGINAYYIFGNDVKDKGYFSNIITSQGFLINQDGKVADVRLSERGYQIGGSIGKIFPLIPRMQNSGVLMKFGIGFMEHKMRIETTGNLAPQLNADYRKGYDRLSNGIQFSQFIGYLFLSSNKLLNVYAGIDFNQAFTKNRRTRNFDTMQADNELHLDGLIGMRVGIILPIYQRKSDAYYYR